MYSKTSRLITVLGILALSSAGCGHKGPPMPPPLQNPALTTNLAVQQRGLELILTFAYPQTTMSGELLTELQSVEFWELVRPVPDWAAPEDSAEALPTEEAEPVDEDAAEPPDGDGDDEQDEEDEDAPLVPKPSKEELVAVEPLEFQATAQLRLTLEGAELKSAIVGDTITMRFPLDPDVEGEIGHIFSVRTYSGPRLGSPFSNLATLVRRTPSPAPTGFTVEALPIGIRISWENEKAEVQATAGDSTVAAATDDEDEDGLVGFHIYRRDAQSRNYDKPLLLLPPTTDQYYDRSGQYGNRYIYSMTAVAENPPLIESALAGEREIDYQDRFAPAPPINLVALAEANRVRLLWDASRAPDLAGYVVFRRQGDGEFLRLNAEAVTDAEYNDLSVVSGTSYDYRVAAVDQLGNLSDPGQPATARVP